MMSSSSSNDNGNTSYMNNRIPRKKKRVDLNNGRSIDSDPTAVLRSAETVTPAKTSLHHHVSTIKSKDGAPPNNKKRNVTPPIATKPPAKKVKTNDNNATSTTAMTQDSYTNSEEVVNKSSYQIVKEGRISGYPIIVKQVGSEHEAILLGCSTNDNPQDFLNKNINGKVKIRWKFAGYNNHVYTSTVRLKEMSVAPPIRKAAVQSGLLDDEMGDEVVANEDDGIDLGEEEDDNAPILKAAKSNMLDNKNALYKDDGDYNDQEDKDEALVCYKRVASVGYNQGGSKLVQSQISESANQDNTDVGGNAFTEFVDTEDVSGDVLKRTEGGHAADEPKSLVAVSHSDFESEVPTSKGIVHIPLQVTSNMNVKTEGEDTDEEEELEQVTSSSDQAVYGYDTDNDDPKPLEVTSDGNIKGEGFETDGEMDPTLEVDTTKPQVVTSSHDIKTQGIGNTYECDTDSDEPQPLAATSSMLNIKAEDTVDTDDEIDAQEQEKGNDNFTSTVSVSTSHEDDAALLKLFEKLNSCLEEGTLADEIETMIKSNPYFVNAKCPQDMGEIEAGCTVMEALCRLAVGPDTCDLLYELVCMGGKATDVCYEEILSQSDYRTPLENLAVLLLSGYIPPKKKYFFLDGLAEGFDEDEGNDYEDGYSEIVKILYKDIRLGDNLSCGDVNKTVINNINGLPPLVIGETHSEGGAMANLLKCFPQYENLQQSLASASDVKPDAVASVNASYEYDTDCDEKNPVAEDATDNDANVDGVITATIILNFFVKLNSMIDRPAIDFDQMKEMIETNPFLLNAKCPQSMSCIEKGYNAVEVCCQYLRADTRDLLYDVLVKLGAKATDRSYYECWKHEGSVSDFVTVLLLSGYYPISNDSGDLSGYYPSRFFLDRLANTLDTDEDEHIEIIRILSKVINLEDNLSCGGVDRTVMNNIKGLPLLKIGVTYSKGGPMDKLLKPYPLEKVEEKKKIEKECMKTEELGLTQAPLSSVSGKVSNAEKPPEKKGKQPSTGTRMCSICKVTKSSVEDFSKTQRGKGGSAKCKGCVAINLKTSMKRPKMKSALTAELRGGAKTWSPATNYEESDRMKRWTNR